MTSVDFPMADGYPFSMQSTSEKILLDQARNGQEQAFTQLVNLHSEKIISLAWRLVGQRDVAEEIAQEAFLRFYRSLESFRGESSVATWLYRTVSRLAIDHLRREKLKRKLFFFRSGDREQADPLDSVADTAPSPQAQMLARETGQQMQQVLQRLPAQQKAVFILRHMEEMPLKEIAVTLGLKEGTVKSHLHRAAEQFRKEFREARKGTP